jgi:hypothetical protein
VAFEHLTEVIGFESDALADRDMSDTPNFSSDEEERIRQKQEEFQNAVEEQKKRHPSGMSGLSGSPGINPGSDPIAREAIIRLMEKNIEQALESHTGQALDPEALQKIRADVREHVNALFARNTKA